MSASPPFVGVEFLRPLDSRVALTRHKLIDLLSSINLALISMPHLGRSLLETKSLSRSQIFSLFEKANQLEASFQKNGNFIDAAPALQNKVLACLFFEPSTRTRMSFQIAAYRLGLHVTVLESSATSSLSKGETPLDTVLNIAALQPDALVVRYGNWPELGPLLEELSIPVLNAGSGQSAHPSQALLDAYTIWRERGQLEKERVLIFGDILHSRVARSNIEVLQKMGAQVGLCGPADWLSLGSENDSASGAPIQKFSTLEEGLKWASVCMGLRVQRERHIDGRAFDSAAYHAEFGLNQNRLALFAKDGLLMHPGPINHGVEFSSEVLQDPRSRVLKQVSYGVLIRGALLVRALQPSLLQSLEKE
jgi:aspartate carbamoyltransferase catalytic subunit